MHSFPMVVLHGNIDAVVDQVVLGAATHDKKEETEAHGRSNGTLANCCGEKPERVRRYIHDAQLRACCWRRAPAQSFRCATHYNHYGGHWRRACPDRPVECCGRCRTQTIS